MSQEEQDAAIGRLVREKKEAETKLVSLKARTMELGNRYRELGKTLSIDPGAITFIDPDAITFDGDSAPDGKPVRSYDRRLFNIEEIERLVTDVQETERLIADHATQLARAGY